jgi:hypothetical protein
VRTFTTAQAQWVCFVDFKSCSLTSEGNDEAARGSINMHSYLPAIGLVHLLCSAGHDVDTHVAAMEMWQSMCLYAAWLNLILAAHVGMVLEASLNSPAGWTVSNSSS